MSGSHRQHRDNPNYKSKMQLNNDKDTDNQTSKKVGENTLL